MWFRLVTYLINFAIVVLVAILQVDSNVGISPVNWLIGFTLKSTRPAKVPLLISQLPFQNCNFSILSGVGLLPLP